MPDTTATLATTAPTAHAYTLAVPEDLVGAANALISSFTGSLESAFGFADWIGPDGSGGSAAYAVASVILAVDLSTDIPVPDLPIDTDYAARAQQAIRSGQIRVSTLPFQEALKDWGITRGVDDAN